MSLHSSADLKDALLDMWVPAIGAKTAEEWCIKNVQKLVGYALDIAQPELEAFIALYHEIIDEKVAEFLTHVFRRNLDCYFDIHPPFQLGKAILTGSLSEGLFLYSTEPPDMDFMCVLKDISFSVEDQENGCLVLRDDTPFVYASVKKGKEQKLWREFCHDDDTQTGKYRLSSKKLKEKMQQNYQKIGDMFRTLGREELKKVDAGAAASIHKTKPSICIYETLLKGISTLLETTSLQGLDRPLTNCCNQIQNSILHTLVPCTDIVLSIFCHEWPSCAREWITRERVWPEIHAVENIARNGFHIVPKSSNDGDFRLSFSCAETMLIQLLSPLQHRVIRAFKAVIKYHQSIWSSTFDGVLTSYHIKTIAFWHFEKSPREYCTEETLVHHLLSLLGDLAEALRVQNLPMYFMPKVNLLHDFDDPDVLLSLADMITEVSQDFSAMCMAVNELSTLKYNKIFSCNKSGCDKWVDKITHRLQNLEDVPDEGDSFITFSKHFFKFVRAILNCFK